MMVDGLKEMKMDRYRIKVNNDDACMLVDKLN
jgi:hypothetical protein